jgi:hypothetical protein
VRFEEGGGVALVALSAAKVSGGVEGTTTGLKMSLHDQQQMQQQEAA